MRPAVSGHPCGWYYPSVREDRLSGNVRTTYLRLSVTDRCDMRCFYCKPADHTEASGEPLSVEEITALVGAFARCGVTKVRITGGEPLLRDDIVDVVAAVARTPGVATVALTTNGARLREFARPLLDAGLHAVNVSLNSLGRGTFRRIAGRDRLPQVLDGLRAAVECGFRKVKTNTVVMRGINDHEMSAIAELARETSIDTRFIELMPIGCARERWSSLFVSAREIRKALGNPEPLAVDGSGTARLYAAGSRAGRIGIISPVSEGFCGACDRIRVTSRGVLIPCLRSREAVDIRRLATGASAEDEVESMLSWCESRKAGRTLMQFDRDCAPAMCEIGG